jgi:hypothetical protein
VRPGRWAIPGLLLWASACATASPLGLSYVLTDDVRVVFSDPDLAPLVPHAVRTFRNAHEWQRRIFGWTPAQRTTLWLRDFSDYGNASVTPTPVNLLRFDVSPMSNPFETGPSNERFYSTMNHEMVHMATTDVADGADRFWRRVFGGKISPQADHPETLLYSHLTVPRWNVPRWVLEGSAVFMETWMAGGQGRAQGGYDEMVFRAMVRDGAPFYDPLGLASRGTRVDFQVGANAYLYGTRFVTWLAWAHSPEKVVAWMRRDDGSRANYADQFQQVFGLSLDDAWKRWIADERRFQQANLEEVRRHPLTPRRPLAAQPLGSVSRAFVAEATGELIAGVRTPGIVDHLAALDLRTGRSRVLTDVPGALLYAVTSLAFDPRSQTVLFTTDNQGFRSLWAHELDTGRQTRLLKEARIGAMAWNPVDRALIGVRHEAGRAALVRIPFPYDDWELMHVFPYGVVPSDLDVSPDGTLLSASVTEVSGDQFVRVYRLAALRAAREEKVSEFRFSPAAPEGFVFSPDGRHLYGSAYYTGVSNIYRFEVATGDVKAVSNAETGFFRPIPRPDGSLIVFEYTGQGFLPVVIDPKPLDDLGTIRFLGAEVAERHPVVTTWQVPAAKTVDDEALVRERGVYEPLGQITLRNVFPILQGYRDARGAGLHANFGDPLGFAHVGITASFTPGQDLPADERGHLEVTGRYLGWHGSLAWNRTSFYDLFGPTKRARRGFAAKLGYDRFLVFEPSRRLEARSALAFYDRLDALPSAQNVGASSGSLLTGEAGLHYSDVRRSLGAVDDEKGVLASAVVSVNRSAGRVVTQTVTTLDAGVPLPLGHMSLWSRSAAGGTGGTRELPIARHYFGAFGNNRIDDGVVKRYREVGSLPGFDIDAVSGRSFFRQMVELNLPPAVFESLGTPGFHLQSLRPAVFATSLWTDPFTRAGRQRFGSVGAQLDLRLAVMHWYDMTLSFGYASGWQRSRRVGDEWMVSLKIL